MLRRLVALLALPLQLLVAPAWAVPGADARPGAGQFVVTVDPAPGGLHVAVLQGRPPGMFVSDPRGTPVAVLGVDGEPFLELGRETARVNVHSRTHVEDQRARGRSVGSPSSTPRFVTVGGSGAAFYTWLDVRLRYPLAEPPEEARRRTAPTTLQRWTIPIRVAGQRTALTGEVRWVPAAATRHPAAPDEGGRSPVLLAVLMAFTAVLGLGGAAVLRRRRL